MSFQKLKDILNPFQTRGPIPDTKEIAPKMYQYKNRWSMIGTVASGKTTNIALLVLAARTLSFGVRKFYCDVVENESSIMEDVSNLQRGRFPAKTRAYNEYAMEPGLLLYWNEMWSNKQIHIPVCDVAGEDLMLGQKGTTMAPGPAAHSAARRLQEYVQESDGLILMAPASKALMFKNDAQLEREPSDIAFDPDVNVARIFGGIIDYKRTHQNSKPLKGCVIMISKWDLIERYANDKEINVNVMTDQGRDNFMQVYFPFTSMKIKAMQRVFNTKVLMVPSFVNVERDGNDNIVYWDPQTRREPKIQVDPETRIPSYGSGWMADTINFLGQFAV